MITAFRKIFIAEYSVDMRKSFDGLCIEAKRHHVQLWEGECLAFVGKNKRIVKILCADPTGIIIIAKKFTNQCIKTKLRFLIDPSIKSISKAEMEMLLEGKDFEVKRQPLGWEPFGNARKA